MYPPSIKVLLREFPENCGLRSPHSLSVWYIVPSIEQNRCQQIWIPATNSAHIGKNVSWFHHKLIMPTETTTNIIIQIAKDLTAALKQINKNPLLPPSDYITRKARFQLGYI